MAAAAEPSVPPMVVEHAAAPPPPVRAAAARPWTGRLPDWRRHRIPILGLGGLGAVVLVPVGDGPATTNTRGRRVTACGSSAFGTSTGTDIETRAGSELEIRATSGVETRLDTCAGARISRACQRRDR